MRHHRDGFTLIELLVVVTIIVVLLALLVPAMDKAIEQAERATCAARLHAWGVSQGQYYFDNGRRLLNPPNLRKGLSRGLYPNHGRWRRTSAEEAGDFSLDAMAPYVQGENTGPWSNATYVGELWFCPSSQDSFWYKNTADTQAKNISPGHPLDDNLSFMYMDYAYFGNIGGMYRNTATRPDQVHSRSMGSGTVLMADTVFLYAGNNTWWFNHSSAGYSMHEPGFGGYVHNGVPPAGFGNNRLFSDGAVAWKGEDQYILADMQYQPNPQSNPFVSADTAATTPNNQVIVNFY